MGISGDNSAEDRHRDNSGRYAEAKLFFLIHKNIKISQYCIHFLIMHCVSVPSSLLFTSTLHTNNLC